MHSKQSEWAVYKEEGHRLMGKCRNKLEGISRMEKQIKTIGVLTSGGDAPGMNAAVRAVVRTGLHKGYRMIGIQRGYNGLLNGECFEMNLRSVSNIISAGGTIL